MSDGLVGVADGLWCATQPLRFLGIEVGARMTVAKLPSGGLLLHSPIEPRPALRAAVEAKGPVEHVVAPNRFHHLFVGLWGDAGPRVQVHVAPGLLAKRPDLAGALELGDVADPAWGEAFDTCRVNGIPMANEVAFLHRPTRTLFTCDLAFNVGASLPAATRFFFKIQGKYGRLETTFLERLLTRDRGAAKASIERILGWDFDRVVVSHGDVLESGGHEAFRRAWSWLL
ncbi:MAG: DUF4336 domain-containing protein [Deltaproteobacteria bacterium]|nr:DUF4336 domain-containing protein [Deltaproteobacteria bacterium]MBW2444295.1 DUF4336 domain-containing protein [Deltaproteobacteria bacterium]